MDWNLLLQVWLYGAGFFTVVSLIQSFIAIKYNKILITVTGKPLEYAEIGLRYTHTKLRQGLYGTVVVFVQVLLAAMLQGVLFPLSLKGDIAGVLRMLNLDYKEIK